MDWNLYRCGRVGHITHAPDEPEIREHVHARTAGGDLWQCMRCGTYVTGSAQGSGPVAQAPVVRRGQEIRSEIILRFFAIERFLRFLVIGGLAYGVYRFGQSPQTVLKAYKHEFPIFRGLFHQLGFNVNHSGVVVELQKVLHFSQAKIYLVAAGLGVYAAVELVEGVGLWLAKRWGEYFAAVATAAFLPLEISELLKTVTPTKLILFLINLALVLYLILTKRLFGVRGGGRAYEARLRSESIFDAIAQPEPGRYPAEVGGAELAHDAGTGGAHGNGGEGSADGGPGGEATLSASNPGGRAGGVNSTADPANTAAQVVPPVPVMPVAPTEPTLRKTPPDVEPG